MNTQSSNTGFMPRSIAITLLTSNQSKTNGFRKRLFRAMERVVEPVSRSTALNVSAPKIGAQRLQARLAKATAAQLHRWHKRTLSRANRLQDTRDEVAADSHNPEGDLQVAAALETLSKRIAAHDGLCQAIIDELTSRATRGKGYVEPLKWSGRLILS